MNYFDNTQEAYIAYYGRPADPTGLIYWSMYLDNSGGNVDDMVNAFGNSPEAQALYGDINEGTIDSVINKIYQFAFNRDADAEGLKYYHDGFVEGRFTAATIMLDVINGAQNNDAIVLQNKVTSAMNFTEVLDPGLDGQDIQATYAGQDDAVAGRAFLATVTSDPTTVITPADAKTYIEQNIADANDPIVAPDPDQTITMVEGPEHVVAGAGNDTIIATDATLDAGDKIDGGEGSDTLKYYGETFEYNSAFEMKNVERVEVTSDYDDYTHLDMSGTTGVDTLATINSSGGVIFDHIPEIADLEVNNLTSSAQTTIGAHFQGPVLAGKEDELTLTLKNNISAKSATIQIGSDVVYNDGLETLNVVSTGAKTFVNTLDSNILNLNVTGDGEFHVTNALNDTINNVDASAFTGDLEISLVGNVGTKEEGETEIKALNVTTGSGDDHVDMTGVTRDSKVAMGEGDDTLDAGQGHDEIDLGAGNDTIKFKANGLTVADTVKGGAGDDTIEILEKDEILMSEADRVTDVERFEFDVAGSTIAVTDSLVNSITGAEQFTVDTSKIMAGTTTIDLTNVSGFTTRKFALDTTYIDENDNDKEKHSTGQEIVIANDGTVNSGATLDFGDGTADTLIVRDGANITRDDLENITGLETIKLESDSVMQQNWYIDVTDRLVDASSNDTLTGGVSVEILKISHWEKQGACPKLK